MEFRVPIEKVVDGKISKPCRAFRKFLGITFLLIARFSLITTGYKSNILNINRIIVFPTKLLHFYIFDISMENKKENSWFLVHTNFLYSSHHSSYASNPSVPNSVYFLPLLFAEKLGTGAKFWCMFHVFVKINELDKMLYMLRKPNLYPAIFKHSATWNKKERMKMTKNNDVKDKIREWIILEETCNTGIYRFLTVWTV